MPADARWEVLQAIEPTPEAEAEWVRTVSQPGFMSDYQATCTPGYYNGEGKGGRGEGFLEGHHQLNDVERVGSQIVNE